MIQKNKVMIAGLKRLDARFGVVNMIDLCSDRASAENAVAVLVVVKE